MATRLLISIPIGLVATLATAWALAARPAPERIDGDDWFVAALDAAPPVRLEVRERIGEVVTSQVPGDGMAYGCFGPWPQSLSPDELVVRIPGWSTFAGGGVPIAAHADGSGSTMIVERAVGWPLPALRAVTISDWRANDLRQVGVVDVPALEVVPGARTSMPALPIVTGLAADSMFFAALAFGAITVPGAARRRWRRRRDRCEACGYPAGPAVCPECGTGNRAA